jgi:hypothetical protein
VEFVNESLNWRKSGRCANGACVEVAQTSIKVYVRQAADPLGDQLVFGAGAWQSFVDGVRDGAFAVTPG